MSANPRAAKLLIEILDNLIGSRIVTDQVPYDPQTRGKLEALRELLERDTRAMAKLSGTELPEWNKW